MTSGVGATFIMKKHFYSICSKNFCNPPGCLIGQKPPVVSYNKAFLITLLFLHHICNSLGHYLHVFFRKILTNKGSPATCTKFYHKLSSLPHYYKNFVVRTLRLWGNGTLNCLSI